MKRLIDKYTAKLASQGLAHPEDITLLCLDADLASNREAGEMRSALEPVFSRISITSLLFAEPAEPYRSIIAALTRERPERLVPSDCETRTFFHDIPVIEALDADAIAQALSLRKAAIVRGRGIVSVGTVSPEQAFVSYSSACFSTFVKYFTDTLFLLEDCAREGARPAPEIRMTFEDIAAKLPVAKDRNLHAIPGQPPRNEDEAIDGIVETGRALVSHGLVDSYFGNISFVFGNTLYISQTGSSLDELETTIDAVPLDGSSSSGITASSELSAHLGIHRATGARAIVHGHPKFSVIMSMCCREPGCDLSACYRTCTKPRSLGSVPVVSGEIGTGPTGLMRTVPAALAGSDAAVVFGHGVFTTGREGFREPFQRMALFEAECREHCLGKMRSFFR